MEETLRLILSYKFRGLIVPYAPFRNDTNPAKGVGEIWLTKDGKIKLVYDTSLIDSRIFELLDIDFPRNPIKAYNRSMDIV